MATPPLIHRVSRRFADYEEFSEATFGWNLPFTQLDPGPSPTHLDQIVTADWSVMRVRLSRRYRQTGSAPPGTRTVALVEEGTPPVRWCGRLARPETLQTFRADGEFEARSEPGFEAYTVSFRPDPLAAVADALGVPDFDTCVGRSEHQVVDAASASRLRAALRQLFPSLEGGEDVSDQASSQLEELPEHLMRAVASTSTPEPRVSASVRYRTYRRAVDWIEEHLDAVPTVRALSQDLGVSRRTLEYAFREGAGVPPKRYVLARRLAAVRSNLLRASPCDRITDVANRFGFWHMGEFAAAYRRQFGELPSETRRSRRHTGAYGNARRWPRSSAFAATRPPSRPQRSS